MPLLVEEETVLSLVARSLSKNRMTSVKLPSSPESWNKLIDITNRHQLASLIAGPLGEEEISDAYMAPLLKEGRSVCLRYYRLAWETRSLCDLLESEGLNPLVHKGCAVASYYPIPDLRKAGDIDIYVGEKGIQRATDALIDAGYTFVPGPPGDHQVCFTTPQGYEIELHRSLARPFNRKSVDETLLMVEDAMHGQRRMVNALPGIDVPTMEEAELAFGLVIHMVQHQLRGGFGLRLLVDWVAFLNMDHDVVQMERLNSYLEEAGLMRFLSVVVACCECWLGLAHDRCVGLRLVQVDDKVVEQFMRDIISAGEFGNSMETALAAPDRASVGGFAREFHHQMLIRHPRASRMVPLWPALWANTLFQFVRNNRKLRHISTIEVLKTAAKRGKTMDGLRLFETEESTK